MRILVLSLLRVGDLFQQRPLLKRLRELYPTADIEVVTNLSCLSSKKLFPEITAWHGFDRDRFQKSLGTAEIPLLAPVVDLENWIAGFTSEPIDLLLNFTHNRLSAQMAAMIPAREKRGLLAEVRGFRVFENSWLRHFNDRFSVKNGTPFHYAEALAGSFAIDLPAPPVSETKGSTVFVQALTSDQKKNWSLSSWKNLVDQIRLERPELNVKVLGAEFEEEKLLTVFESEDLAILDWEHLQVALQKSQLLITGDTSVKHLAASLGVPILELALGSADPFRTGVYAKNAFVLHAAVECAPCVHSQPCRQMSHLCGENLSLKDVVRTTLQILSGDEPSPPLNKKIKLYRTDFVAGAGWMLSANAVDAVDQAAWKLALDGEKIPALGSTAWELKKLLLREDLQVLQKEQRELEERLSQAESSLKQIGRQLLAGQHEAHLLQEVRRAMNSVTSLSTRVRRHLLDLNEVGIEPFPSPLHFYGAFKKRIEELKVRTEMRGKLIQQLLLGEKEHGKESGESSDGSLKTLGEGV